MHATAFLLYETPIISNTFTERVAGPERNRTGGKGCIQLVDFSRKLSYCEKVGAGLGSYIPDTQPFRSTLWLWLHVFIVQNIPTLGTLNEVNLNSYLFSSTYAHLRYAFYWAAWRHARVGQSVSTQSRCTITFNRCPMETVSHTSFSKYSYHRDPSQPYRNSTHSPHILVNFTSTLHG